jgi:MFS family permease
VIGQALAITVLVQAVVAASHSAAGVLAPVVAPDLGFQASSIGAFIGIATFTALFGGTLIDGFLRRYGAVRTLQLALALVVAALLLATTRLPALVLLAAPLIGLAAGMMAPATIQGLVRIVPSHRSGLVFGINQCGVPIGAGLAGVLLPAMLGVMRWEATLLILALVAAGAALLAQPARASMDAAREPHASLASRALWGPLKLVLEVPQLRLLCWVAFASSTMQVSLLAYLVTYLNLELGVSHIGAGTALLVSQLVALPTRLLYGWLLDRVGGHMLALGVLGIASGVAALGLAIATPAWPYWALLALAALAGASSMGWNGIYSAAVVRAAPEGRSGSAVGGAQVFGALGGILGPIVFALLVTAIGYAWTFAALALVPLAMGVAVVMRAARADGRGD